MYILGANFYRKPFQKTYKERNRILQKVVSLCVGVVQHSATFSFMTSPGWFNNLMALAEASHGYWLF
jgi:hypothetical protein